MSTFNHTSCDWAKDMISAKLAFRHLWMRSRNIIVVNSILQQLLEYDSAPLHYYVLQQDFPCWYLLNLVFLNTMLRSPFD